MRHPYFDCFQLIERLHRHFLEVVKIDLDRAGIQDINAVQALILYNIGHDELTVGELTARGYYLGTNVSYNVKNLVESGYLQQDRSPHDKRSVRVKLAERGLQLHQRLQESLDKQVAKLGAAQIGQDDLAKANDGLRKLERFWTNMLNFGGLGD
ncbi:MAG: MarR family transcriptional regulator [Alphaproteobacteria bacterium]|nr:MarR family transcriptional regulator [Alphaproteobacteria bacterium]NBZ95019.1 MarR family transcriptional regulator [Pseudomonadota bacterium]NDC56234.1 MarR family transcriptional regulator [Alphaproteobacteria bacterium]NDG04345.1 MarR family transcriptional regulator [Alphaproteobacteria bacterium]